MSIAESEAEPDLLTETEAAELLRVSVWTLMRARQDEENPLPFLRARGQVRYVRGELLHWAKRAAQLDRKAVKGKPHATIRDRRAPTDLSEPA